MFMPPKQLIKCKLDEHVRRDARPGCAANSAYDLRNVQRQKIIENYRRQGEKLYHSQMANCHADEEEPKADMANTSQRMAKRAFISIAKNQRGV